jgi:hypothetical protein
MTLEVVEVVRRSQQGVTQPFVCRADDGNLYFVKGKGAGYASLAREWLAGKLAIAFGLPIPSFAVLHVSGELYGSSSDGKLNDLGSGPVFGSMEVPMSNEISMTETGELGIDIRRDIAVFDWWIMNGDRTLSENGGNPNILWSLKSGGPHVIDHNVAFDPQITLSSLVRDHIFGHELSEIADTPYLQESFSERFRTCLEGWNEICGTMPERWRFLDDLCSIGTGFSDEQALTILRRHEIASMWTRL